MVFRLPSPSRSMKKLALGVVLERFSSPTAITELVIIREIQDDIPALFVTLYSLEIIAAERERRSALAFWVISQHHPTDSYAPSYSGRKNIAAMSSHAIVNAHIRSE